MPGLPQASNEETSTTDTICRFNVLSRLVGLDKRLVPQDASKGEAHAASVVQSLPPQGNPDGSLRRRPREGLDYPEFPEFPEFPVLPVLPVLPESPMLVDVNDFSPICVKALSVPDAGVWSITPMVPLLHSGLLRELNWLEASLRSVSTADSLFSVKISTIPPVGSAQSPVVCTYCQRTGPVGSPPSGHNVIPVDSSALNTCLKLG
jgi:hypothetical protein